jgi:glycosyltransferase involved in cell wall biosynthesis
LDGLSSGKDIAYIGRLSWEKGADRLVEIAKGLPDDPIYVFGDGEMMDELRKSPAQNLVLMGGTRSMDSVWKNIGLVIMPSRAEGLPLVAIEAMARGIPVIANCVGDLGKLVQHGKSGWLLDTYDREVFVNYIKSWKNMGMREKLNLSTCAFKKVKYNYSSDICVPKIIKVYDKCFSNQSHR